MKKLVMIDFVILILVELQANDLTPTSFNPSSLQVLLPLSFNLDNVQESFYTFHEENLEICLESLKDDFVLLARCIKGGYRYSLIVYGCIKTT